MPFNPKRYSRLASDAQRAWDRLQVAPPAVRPTARKVYGKASHALSAYVNRWRPAEVPAE